MKNNKQIWFQVQFRRKDHATWRIDLDSNESMFRTRLEAEEKIKEESFKNLETRIVEVK